MATIKNSESDNRPTTRFGGFSSSLVSTIRSPIYAWRRARYRTNLRKKEKLSELPPVLIYQMGKVGSTTVELALKESDLKREIYHFHTLDPSIVSAHIDERRRFLDTDREWSLRRAWLSEYISEQTIENQTKRKWDVITLVRDPVSRNVGTFFQHLDVCNDSESSWSVRSIEYDFEIEFSREDLTPLVDLFFERCRHDNALIFFEREFERLFGLDVYAEPFPKNRGFNTYSSEKLRLLLLRLEDLNQSGPSAVGDFLGVASIGLSNKNGASQKQYAQLYDAFKKNAILPTAYLDKMYTSRMARHFYTDEELDAFRGRWSRVSGL